MGLNLTGTGVWSSELLREPDRGAAADAAAELEELGYTALWFPAGDGTKAFDTASELLRATSSVTLATGILSVYVAEPDFVAAQTAELSDAYEGRFLLGLGVSHEALVGERYEPPLPTMRAYLDSLDAAAPPVPRDSRVIAALGPKMLELAAKRSLGTHPYLVTPEHTRIAREAVGAERLVAPEQGVVLERDPERARTTARGFLEVYLGLPNYANNLRRFGFEDADFEGGGSDRLVDALIAWGDEETIAARIQEHRDAGADQVLVQVIAEGGRGKALPRDEWRALAPALIG
jgi:probable F420-dependent oxidoreductase